MVSSKKRSNAATKKKIADTVIPIMGSIIAQVETKEIKPVIEKFMGKGYKYNKSWNNLIPVATKCFQQITKRRIKEEQEALQGIKKLAPTMGLKEYISIAVMQNSIEILSLGLHQTITWLNKKTK